MKFAWRVLLFAVCVGSALHSEVVAGLFKMDFGTLENFDELDDWDEFETFSFLDFDDEIATWELSDFSDGGDDDVVLTILDQEEIADDFGSFANGMIHNNPVQQLEDVVYDGVDVPAAVKDDYLYRDPDTAGTELLFRFENLDPGEYNVTLFLGRTSDANGQFGKIWVESDETGQGEPDDENTGNFAGFDPDEGVEDPEGFPVTLPVTITDGEFLWFGYMEDASGGLSGIIIRQTETAGGPAGDFNGNGMRDVADIDLLTGAMGGNDGAFDLNEDGKVDFEDRRVWVEDLSNTFIGDANFDGQFNSSDFVAVFGAAKYEKGVAASWSEGDWNGDGIFSSSDFVAAFSGGGYERGAREGGLQTVPEPSSIVLVLFGLCGLSRAVRRRK